IRPAIRAGKGGAQCHHDQVEQLVPASPLDSRIGKIFKRGENSDQSLGHDQSSVNVKSRPTKESKQGPCLFQASCNTVRGFRCDCRALRRSHDRRKGLGALHSVSVWASDFGLTLAQVACEQKSNEITAI